MTSFFLIFSWMTLEAQTLNTGSFLHICNSHLEQMSQYLYIE